jgi:hypothetical protein
MAEPTDELGGMKSRLHMKPGLHARVLTAQSVSPASRKSGTAKRDGVIGWKRSVGLLWRLDAANLERLVLTNEDINERTRSAHWHINNYK